MATLNKETKEREREQEIKKMKFFSILFGFIIFIYFHFK
jgi:hypothetical protein